MQTAEHTSELLIPLMWIAGASFLAGFLGYLTLGLNSLGG
jgi:hypothetical protein